MRWMSRSAAELAMLYDAAQRGVLLAVGDRVRRCATEIDQTLSSLVGAAG